jgi:hypothetical protein
MASDRWERLSFAERIILLLVLSMSVEIAVDVTRLTVPYPRLVIQFVVSLVVGGIVASHRDAAS